MTQTKFYYSAFKVAFILCIFSNMITAQTISIHSNPSFEYVIQGTSAPLYWKNNTDATSDFNVFVDFLNKYSNNSSLCIEGTKLLTENVNWYNEKGGIAFLELYELNDFLHKQKTDSIDVKISLRYNLKASRESYSLIGFSKTTNFGVKHFFSKDTLLDTNGKWAKKNFSFKLLKNEEWAQLSLLFNGIGKVFFDDLELSFNGVVIKSIKPKEPTKTDINFINKNAIPIKSCDFQSSDNNITQIIENLPNFKVIGLGESTHGTSEFHSLRAKVIKELILKRNLNFVILETNFSESFIALNNFVIDGKGTAEQALRYTLVWPWQTTEMVELLNWIKIHNQTAQNKVHVGGMDVQFNYLAAKQIRKTLIGIDSALILPIRKELDFLIDKSPYVSNEWSEKKDSIMIFEQSAKKINSYLQDIKQIIINKQNNFETKILFQHAENLNYFAGMMTTYNRELYSSLNIEWIESSFPNAKIAILAHNAHTTPNKSQNGTGYLLKSKYGDNYLSIGFTTSFGEYTALDPIKNIHISNAKLIPPTPESLENLLSKCKYSNFFIPIKNKETLPTFFKNDLKSLGIGSIATPNQTFTIISDEGINKYFDGIFFIKTTKGTTLTLE